jgi:putative FmdB family regulatory protein
MPIYEYVCDDCHEAFEKLVLSPREAVSCPSCHSESVERQLSTFACRGADGGFRGSVAGGCGATSCAGCSGCCRH